MFETGEKAEKFILIAIDDGEGQTESSLDELAELAKTAGAEVAGRLVQKLDRAVPSTYLGSGKLMELKMLLEFKEADGVIADDELTNAQMSGMQKLLDCKVMDRTMLILDIFARHAHSAEGMLQVELAQQDYRLTRLTGQGVNLSRLGGGIGTRGPGEKKLEVDRRVIRKRIAFLHRELKEMQAHREVTRKKRADHGISTFAIVGYTNAGTSTLLNALTGADIPAADMLFATLDTTTRKYRYQSGNSKREVLLTDTVGFIRKLPHHLVEAFKSTLSEAAYADHIIHVVDASDPAMEEKMMTVYETLSALGIRGGSVLTLFNKIDRCDKDAREQLRDPKARRSLKVSALTKEGLEQIPEALDKLCFPDCETVEGLLPFSDGGVLNVIRHSGKILEEKYTEDGVFIRALLPKEKAALLAGGKAEAPGS